MKLNKNIFSTRFPKTNVGYIKKLNESVLEKYLHLYEYYLGYLYEYLERKLNLSVIDDSISNSKYGFTSVKEKDKDMYQLLSKYKNIYIRNNIYIEKLTKEEIEYLTKLQDSYKKYDDEIEKFIEKTYKKVISASNNHSTKINYGPSSIEEFYIPSDNLLIGYRVNDIKFGSRKYSEKKEMIDSCKYFISGKTLGKIDCGISVLQYDSNSIIKIEGNNSEYVNDILNAITPFLIDGVEAEYHQEMINKYKEELFTNFNNIKIPNDKYDLMLKVEINDEINLLKNYSPTMRKSLYVKDDNYNKIVDIANMTFNRAIDKGNNGISSDEDVVKKYEKTLISLKQNVMEFNYLSAHQLIGEAIQDLYFSAGLSEYPSMKTSHYINKENKNQQI